MASQLVHIWFWAVCGTRRCRRRFQHPATFSHLHLSIRPMSELVVGVGEADSRTPTPAESVQTTPQRHRVIPFTLPVIEHETIEDILFVTIRISMSISDLYFVARTFSISGSPQMPQFPHLHDTLASREEDHCTLNVMASNRRPWFASGVNAVRYFNKTHLTHLDTYMSATCWPEVLPGSQTLRN